ncbi:MAG: MmcQ/YjbR family DNA-binding protein [Propionibacteriales bacterium]|nr:MmcQ/YjbR family DNA-binding protein [Propionibacteriales bacterium]
MPVTAEDVRDIALALPRAFETETKEATKYKVGRLVFAAVSGDGTRLGFGFPRDERDALIAGEPEKFLLPRASDLRYNWVAARLAELDLVELGELLTEAWCLCVPKFVREAYFAGIDD